MHYFEHHIGDYAAATSHLSLVEDAVYSRMLRRYYLTEAPLPADWMQVARLSGARTDDELSAVKAVLAEFFVLTDEGYRQKRADLEIAEFHARQVGKAEERSNEAERKRRYRERRSGLFEQLRGMGIVPAFDTPTDELVRLLSHGTSAGQVQGQDGDGTATHPPSPISHPQEKQKHVQRSAARFAEFWTVYPVKKGKTDAEKAWRKKGCDAIADQIIEHVRLMQAHDDDWKRDYIPHGSTYVNGERWQDQPKRASPQAGQQGQPSKTLNAIQRLEGMKHGLADSRTDDRIPEVALLGVGSHPGDRLDRGDGHGLGGSGAAGTLVG